MIAEAGFCDESPQRFTCLFAAFVVCLALLGASCTRKPAGPAVHVAVTMRKFAIEPNVIELRQGQNALLDVSSKDVQHGFKVEQLGINQPIQPGKPVEIPVDTSKKGDFEVVCSIVCGAGHDDMRARIVVW